MEMLLVTDLQERVVALNPRKICKIETGPLDVEDWCTEVHLTIGSDHEVIRIHEDVIAVTRRLNNILSRGCTGTSD